MEIERSKVTFCYEDGIYSLSEEEILPRHEAIEQVKKTLEKSNMLLVCSPSFTGKTSLV